MGGGGRERVVFHSRIFFKKIFRPSWPQAFKGCRPETLTAGGMSNHKRSLLVSYKLPPLWPFRDRSPNTEEGGPGEKWGARKIIWVSRGGRGKKIVVQRGGPQKNNKIIANIRGKFVKYPR